MEPGDISRILLSTCKQHFTASINLSLCLLAMQNVCIILHWCHFSMMLQLSGRSDCSERRKEVRITVYIYYTLAACTTFYCHANFVAFEKLCVARCRHDFELRTSLAEGVEGQILIDSLPDVLAQSRDFISGRSPYHVPLIYH